MTGGWYSISLSSTEIFVDGEWTFAGELPHRMYYIRAVSIDHKVIMAGDSVCLCLSIQISNYNLKLGGYDDDGKEASDAVVYFDVNSLIWVQLGTLNNARYLYAMTLVNWHDIEPFCH